MSTCELVNYSPHQSTYLLKVQQKGVCVCLQSTVVAYLLLTQQPRVRIQLSRIFFREKVIAVAEVNQQPR